MRKCGECQLCCKLLPVHDIMKPWSKKPLHKNAGERCRYQKVGKGCTIYNTAEMPECCKLWNCRWIVNNDTADQRRPDRSHYVIDVMPDFVEYVEQSPEGTRKGSLQVVQIWVDPDYPDAWDNPELKQYLERRGKEGIAGLVRLSSSEAFTIIPPAMMANMEWKIVYGNSVGRTHTAVEIHNALTGGETNGV